MSGTYHVVMGDRGGSLSPRTSGIALAWRRAPLLSCLKRPPVSYFSTRAQLQQLVRSDLAGLDLVGELLAERRAEAAAEDAA